MTRPDHPRPEVVAALAEAWSKHSTISDRPWSTIEHQMEDFIAAIHAAGWTLSRRSEREALVAALEGLWEAANRYRQDVAKANEYLNQDLPSARSLVFALGKARAAIEGRP